MQRESRSPFQPDDVVASAPDTAPVDVAAAVVAAREASREWSRLPAPARTAALDAAAEAVAARAGELADLIVREVGKPIGEAQGEVGRSVAILRYFAQCALDPSGEVYEPSTAGGMLLTRRRPHGAAGLITPWNFPLAIPLWKAAPALAYGNGVVLKPSPEALGCARELAAILAAELPDGLVHLVPGDAQTGAALVNAADVVSFTGSAAVGASVAAAAGSRGIGVQCEMGGQNASIICADAQTPAVAGVVAGAAMGYAGQKCTATSRVIVVGDPGPFAELLVEAVEGLRTGDPAVEGVVAGPVVTEAARERVLDAAAHARADGGRILTGGGAGDGEGWHVAPTVVDGLDADHELAQTEVFGPFATVLSAPDLPAAVEMANGVAYGLVTSVFTADLATVLTSLEDIDTGMVRVNAPTSGVDFYAPFGGEKASSIGPREQGKAAASFYTSSRTLTIAPPP